MVLYISDRYRVGNNLGPVQLRNKKNSGIPLLLAARRLGSNPETREGKTQTDLILTCARRTVLGLKRFSLGLEDPVRYPMLQTVGRRLMALGVARDIKVDCILMSRRQVNEFQSDALGSLFLVSLFADDPSTHVHGSPNFCDHELQRNLLAHHHVKRRLKQHAALADIQAPQSNPMIGHCAGDIGQKGQTGGTLSCFPFGEHSQH
jgi:hypothetical protein